MPWKQRVSLFVFFVLYIYKIIPIFFTDLYVKEFFYKYHEVVSASPISVEGKPFAYPSLF